ncbi:hypothetical protein [Dietzia sp. 179-F 9C3 NHS]|uniref:hypothetical protein n=1 Tax=Dietzia sp. 179-F 9C3 NHS TaxID=3374295 RepID=UPI003879A52E
MYSVDIPLAAAVLSERAEKAPPAAPQNLHEFFDVITEVDDASAWLLGDIPVHVEPFYQRGPDGEVLSDCLFVTVRYGALASSLMVEVDTEAMRRAASWLRSLTVLADQITEAAQTVSAHLLPKAATG